MTTDSHPRPQSTSSILEEDLKQQMHQLRERLKELQCLYSLTEFGQLHTTVPDMLQKMVEIIRSAWQFPDITCARISISRDIFTTAGFQESPWRQSCDINANDERAGSLEVFYSESRPEADEGPFLKEERLLLEAVCRLIGQMIERKQAEEKLRSLAIELSLAEQRERLRIATHIHDEVAQPLALLRVKIGTLHKTASLQDCGVDFSAMGNLIEQTINTIRSVSFDLAPPILYNYGFEAALEQLLQNVEDHQHMEVRYQKTGTPVVLDRGLEVLLYTMAREIIMNVVKHAQSESLDVILDNGEEHLKITFQDYGIGFNPLSHEKKKHKDGGFGLFSIRERMKHFGGTFIIESASGKGTRAVLSVPVYKVESHED